MINQDLDFYKIRILFVIENLAINKFYLRENYFLTTRKIKGN